jgi:carbon-monoxide dehydrogenase medium subunit
VSLLAASPGHARLLAGGTDLLVALRAGSGGLAIVDMKGIADLSAPLRVTESRLEFGPTLTMTEVASNETVQAWLPGVAEAAVQVGSQAIRNRATLIGNLCNASPAGDLPCPLLVSQASADQARVELTGPDGARWVPLENFILGNRRTACGATEMVTRLVIERPPAGTSSAYLRMTRRKGVDLVTVAAAAAVDRQSRVRLAFAAVGPTPILSDWSAEVDVDDAGAVMEVVEQAARLASPITNIRGSADYRAAMLRVLGQRAITIAAARRIKGEIK